MCITIFSQYLLFQTSMQKKNVEEETVIPQKNPIQLLDLQF